MDLGKLADEFVDVSGVPSDSDMEKLRKVCKNLVDTDTEIRDLESRINDLKKDRQELQTKTIPSVMERIGIDRFGLAEAGVDVVLEPYYHANISKDWDDEKRDAAFAHLKELDGEDLVKTVLSVSAGRETYDKMEQLRSRVVQMLAELDLDASVVMDLSVAWSSLTSFVKEVHQKGAVINTEKLGATIGQIVKIKKRK